MMYLTLASLVILGAFIGLSVWRFGLQKSYSTYAKLWEGVVPKKVDLNVWRVVTIIVALLQVIPMISTLEGSAIQFVGFLTPVYLVAVACTPNYQDDKGEKIVHYIATALCAVGFLVCLAFGMQPSLWWLPLVWAAGFLFFIGLPSRSFISSLVLWLECAMFAASYTVQLLPYVQQLQK